MKVLLAAVLVAASPVLAQETFEKAHLPALCQSTAFVSKAMAEYKEEVLWAAKEDDGILVSVWQNKTTQSFTIIKTSKDGKVSCIISSGTGFQN